MTSLVKELCLLNGVSSGEDEVRDFLIQQARPYADHLRVDALGTLIVFKGREGHRQQADAHRPHG